MKVFQSRMSQGTNRLAVIWLGAALVGAGEPARAQAPSDLSTAFGNSFSGVEACAALRDIAPGAQPATSDRDVCVKRMPPCATFEIAATVIALDRGVVPDANAPVKRNPAQQGDPPDGINLRDALRRPNPWVFEEVARRIGADAFAKSLGAMRYGNAEARGPVERIGRGEDEQGLSLSAVEQLDFLARLKRGELPTSAESQARTVESMPRERLDEGGLTLKSGSCDGAAWAVGWVDREQRSTLFAVVETGGESMSEQDVIARTRKLLADLALIPQPPAGRAEQKPQPAGQPPQPQQQGPGQPPAQQPQQAQPPQQTPQPQSQPASPPNGGAGSR